MEFDEKRPDEPNRFLRPLAIRKVKENKEDVAKAIEVSAFALRIRSSVIASAKEALNQRHELQQVFASENAQIIEKVDSMKQKYFQMKNPMEARLSDERRQFS